LLNKIAFSIVMANEVSMLVSAFVVMTCGFGLALIIWRHSTHLLRRTPYFLINCLISLAGSVLSWVWVLTDGALVNGIFWLPVAIITLGIFAMGFAYGAAAHRRALDGYGKSQAAWMALVPILNFVLLFKPSIDENSTAKSINPTVGVVVGIALLAIGQGIQKAAENQQVLLISQVAADPTAVGAARKELINGIGLEAALAMIAADTATGAIDEVTTLVRTDSTATALRYLYQVTGDVTALPDGFQETVANSVCTDPEALPVIEAEGSFEFHYVGVSGAVLGSVIVSGSDCTL
jgi:hypothetical protein